MRAHRLIPVLSVVGLSVSLEACKGCRDDGITPIVEEPEDPHDIGQYLSMGVYDGQPAVAYYDRTSGGLAFSLGEIQGESVTWTEERVDGYPDANGLDAGDVGKYTSMQIDGDTIWVSYYDVSNGRLFYARRNGKDDWETGVADTGSGPTPRAGLFSSMALDSSGNPVVAHFDQGKGQLRVARWSGSSFTGSVVDEGEGWEPADTAVNLDAKDPEVGKYAKLVIVGGTEYLAYYDGALGNLKLATGSGGGWDIEVVDDGWDEATGEEWDVGQWPAILVDGDELVIAYQDVTNYDLRVARGTPGGTWTVEVVDDGPFTGSDAELYMNGSYPAVVYFDGNENNIKLAINDGSSWTVDTLAGEEAALGFHNESVVIGGKRYVACYDYSNRTIWFREL